MYKVRFLLGHLVHGIRLSATLVAIIQYKM